MADGTTVQIKGTAGKTMLTGTKNLHMADRLLIYYAFVENNKVSVRLIYNNTTAEAVKRLTRTGMLCVAIDGSDLLVFGGNNLP